MKKIFILAIAMIAMASGLSVKAQSFTVSPEIGFERMGYHVGDSKEKGITTHTGNGIRIGASVTYGIDCGLNFRSGLFYSHRGGGHLYNVNEPSRLPFVRDLQLRTTDFLTLPLTVGYRLRLYRHLTAGVEAGGYIASGLGQGNSFFNCTNGENNGGSVFDDSTFTLATPDGTNREAVAIKGSGRIDAGCLFGVHISFHRFTLRGTYQLGLCKTFYDMAMPRTLTISLAYDFRL